MQWRQHIKHYGPVLSDCRRYRADVRFRSVFVLKVRFDFSDFFFRWLSDKPGRGNMVLFTRKHDVFRLHAERIKIFFNLMRRQRMIALHVNPRAACKIDSQVELKDQ